MVFHYFDISFERKVKYLKHPFSLYATENNRNVPVTDKDNLKTKF
jgi:hypothetical protein